jgi:hypothetical protein
LSKCAQTILSVPNLKKEAGQNPPRVVAPIEEEEFEEGRSQWLRGLELRSAAARLLGLWIRIPPGHGRLSVVSVMCQVEVSTAS